GGPSVKLLAGECRGDYLAPLDDRHNEAKTLRQPRAVVRSIANVDRRDRSILDLAEPASEFRSVRLYKAGGRDCRRREHHCVGLEIGAVRQAEPPSLAALGPRQRDYVGSRPHTSAQPCFKRLDQRSHPAPETHEETP